MNSVVPYHDTLIISMFIPVEIAMQTFDALGPQPQKVAEKARHVSYAHLVDNAHHLQVVTFPDLMLPAEEPSTPTPYRQTFQRDPF